jgi:hypothetical protein
MSFPNQLFSNPNPNPQPHYPFHNAFPKNNFFVSIILSFPHSTSSFQSEPSQLPLFSHLSAIPIYLNNRIPKTFQSIIINDKIVHSYKNSQKYKIQANKSNEKAYPRHSDGPWERSAKEIHIFHEQTTSQFSKVKILLVLRQKFCNQLQEKLWIRRVMARFSP